MNFKDYEALQADMHTLRTNLNKSKSHDYANDTDMLENFKRIGKCVELLGINTMDGTMLYCSLMILMKIDRISNLIKQGKTPMNEGLKDSFIDAHNYLDLMYANLFERNNVTQERKENK